MKDNDVADKFRDEGNAFFSQVNFYQALISYNKSLCHAEPQSVQMGLAYSNRSAVYLELKEFDKCLANIQLARDNNYPHEAKLEEREEKCKEMMKTHQRDTKNDPWNYIKLSYPPNEKIPWMADCLELKTNEKYGRHITTNRKLKPGDVIAIEEPIFPLVAKSALFQRCTFCFKANLLNLIPCNCSSAMFCDQECFIKGRDRFHGAICLTIDSVYARLGDKQAIENISVWRGLLESQHAVPDPEVLQDLTNSTKQTTIFDYDLSHQQDGPDIDFKYLSIINDLGVHFPSSDRELLKSLSRIVSSNCVKRFLQPQTPEARALLVKYSTNLAMISLEHSFDLGRGENSEGQGIFPIRSIYSHSCDANTFEALVDNKMVHIVIKPIRKGEQLFISYGYNLGFLPDRVERQEALMKLSNFKCSCIVCRNDYSFLSLPRYDPTFHCPDEEVPSTIESIDGLMEELQKSFEYIQKKFKNYPSYEVAVTNQYAKLLMISIEQMSFWPFGMIN